MSYKIIKKKGHYEVYIDGKFLCTTDTFREACDEVEKLGKLYEE